MDIHWHVVLAFEGRPTPLGVCGSVAVAKKKSLLSKPVPSNASEILLAPGSVPGGAKRPAGGLSMRQLIAKKLAAEKLLTAKRPS